MATLAACSMTVVACDNDAKVGATPDAGTSGVAPQAVAPPPPEPPRAPDIIVDPSTISIGNDRVPGGEPGLADKVAVLLTGRPAIAGRPVDFVALRNAKPSQVAAVVSALHRAQASEVGVKTETRDRTTQRLPLSFASSVGDCTTVAWIAKDGAIDVWPAAGGTAKRIIKGIAGPDMTLGTEAVLKHAGSCSASELVVGADDHFPWGLVFDLATMSMQAPGARTSRALLVTNAVPGRKLVIEGP